MIFVFDREENFVEKGENAGCQYFLLFPHFFKRLFTQVLLKVRIVWWRD